MSLRKKKSRGRVYVPAFCSQIQIQKIAFSDFEKVSFSGFPTVGLATENAEIEYLRSWTVINFDGVLTRGPPTRDIKT